MSILLEPGKYVVAVSGGIDSVVLLHMLRKVAGIELVVAHFDHGIREDSSDDAGFVAGLAGLAELPFELGTGRLGPAASEETARHHRYAFLHGVRARHGAQAVITAHHQDDVIETALLNVMRGTRRRGFVSLQSTDEIKRPLLGMTKQEIREYAVVTGLEWVEDSTNSDMKFARNRVRARLHLHLTAEKRHTIAKLLSEIGTYNAQIDAQVNEILIKTGTRLEKEKITTMDGSVAAEIVAGWLRNHDASFDKTTIGRLLQGAKELRNGSKIDIDKRYYCSVTKHEIVLTRRESV